MPQHDPDFQMALLLQAQFQKEAEVISPPENLTYQKKSKKFNDSKTLIDPSWELIDPTPNVFTMFVQFNQRFFWDKLGSVSVSWSKRMTSCAGICQYSGRNGECKITLSEPLLKLRPRKDFVETLLHEMIHAFLFVTHNNRDRDGHGPEFCKHMNRINNEVGTKITIYHDFHDEVELYQQHWWRCNGPCQNQKPFFGMVRRAMNRAPGPNDRWWAQHQMSCGGTFTKVREPEKPVKPKKTVAKINTTNDIRKYGNNITNSFTKTASDPKSVKQTTSTGQLTPDKIPTPMFTDKPKIDNRKNSSPDVSIKEEDVFDYSVVRNHWLEKFDGKSKQNNSHKRKSHVGIDNMDEKTKKLKTEVTEIFDDDITTKFKTEEPGKINNAITKDDNSVTCPICNKKVPPDDINSHLDNCVDLDNDITVIDDNKTPTDYKKSVKCPICDIFVLDEILNEHLDTCLITTDVKTVKTETVIASTSSEMKECDLCYDLLPIDRYTLHLERCLHKLYDHIEEKYNLNINTKPVMCLVCNKKISKTELSSHLDDCMVSVFDDNVPEDDYEDNKESKFKCSFCEKHIPDDDVASHISMCVHIDKDKYISKTNHFVEDKKDVKDPTEQKMKYNCPLCLEPFFEEDMDAHITRCLNSDEDGGMVSVFNENTPEEDFVEDKKDFCDLTDETIKDNSLNPEKPIAEDHMDSDIDMSINRDEGKYIFKSSHFLEDKKDVKDLTDQKIKYNCPLCLEPMFEEDMGAHIPRCLNGDEGKPASTEICHLCEKTFSEGLLQEHLNICIKTFDSDRNA